MEVLIFKYFTPISSQALYWCNIVSAILDNATLTAAEIGPALSQNQINAALTGLLIFGGCSDPLATFQHQSAGKPGITISEYAKLGVPFGIVLSLFLLCVDFLCRIHAHSRVRCFERC